MSSAVRVLYGVTQEAEIARVLVSTLGYLTSQRGAGATSSEWTTCFLCGGGVSREVDQGGKAHSERGLNTFSPGLNTMEKVSGAPASISYCFLTADAV